MTFDIDILLIISFSIVFVQFLPFINDIYPT